MPRSTSHGSGVRALAALSSHADAARAADSVCEQILAEDRDAAEPADSASATSAPAFDLVLACIGGDHAQHADDVGRVLRDTLGPRTLLGITAEAIVGSDIELSNRPGVSALALSLPGARVEPFTYRDLPHATPDDPEAMADLAQALHLADDTRAVVLFADPFSVPAASLVEAFSALPSVLPDRPAVPLIGGLASSAKVPGQNALLMDGSSMRTGAVGATISGPVAVDTLVSQGCRPIGEPWVVTKARRNVVLELGGRKAIDVVRETVQGLSDQDRALLSAGLHVGRVINEYKSRFGRGDFLIRGVLGVDQNSGAIAVTDALKVGQTIQFHLRDADTASEDLELLLQAQAFRGTPAGSFLITCNQRGQRLFAEPHHDASLISRAFAEPADFAASPELDTPDANNNDDALETPPFPLAGFFAAGEIGPIGDRSFLHGHTAVLASFRDREPGDDHPVA